MTTGGKIQAWIEQTSAGTVIAAFVGVTTSNCEQTAIADRPPATRELPSAAKARQWIESEARELDLPVEWVDRMSANLHH